MGRSEFMKLLLGAALMLVSQNGLAADKIVSCMTLGDSYDSALGVRIFESEAGELVATIDQIDTFYGAIVSYEPAPLKEYQIKEVHLCGGLNIYNSKGGEFVFLPDNTDPSLRSKPTVGTISLTDEKGVRINYKAFEAVDQSGYCSVR